MNLTIRPCRDDDWHAILHLYNSVGWQTYTREPDTLRRALTNSLLVLAACRDDRPVGLIRVVGDGETILFIQDLLVHPDFQRNGIGSALAHEILDHYPHVRQIQLTTDNTPETVAFYTSLGFRPHSEFGCIGFRASPSW